MPSHSHFSSQTPSEWVTRFAPLCEPDAEILDFASGAGRHARWLAGHGFSVLAADRDESALAGLAGADGVRTLCVDLEQGAWPWVAASFDAVVVARYLFRPRLAELAALLRPGGVLIYETFMLGNERFGKPSNPDFLLRPDELFDWARGWGRVLAFEQGEVVAPVPAMIQRICAVRADTSSRLP
ncbi:MAG: SAM-dependent methyltransferase [Methyloversatilis sp. 12-65-5]|nr:MAG: SAM-dependent methyltransferase [Methyloversatilis sp. 12-65-5]